MTSQDWPDIGRKLYLELAAKFPNDPRLVRSILLIVQGELLRKRIGAHENEADRIVAELISEFNGVNGASAVLHEALPLAKKAEKMERDKRKIA